MRRSWQSGTGSSPTRSGTAHTAGRSLPLPLVPLPLPLYPYPNPNPYPYPYPYPTPTPTPIPIPTPTSHPSPHPSPHHGPHPNPQPSPHPGPHTLTLLLTPTYGLQASTIFSVHARGRNQRDRVGFLVVEKNQFLKGKLPEINAPWCGRSGVGGQRARGSRALCVGASNPRCLAGLAEAGGGRAARCGNPQRADVGNREFSW
jgi:hypothetical protein